MMIRVTIAVLHHIALLAMNLCADAMTLSLSEYPGPWIVFILIAMTLIIILEIHNK